MIFDKFNGVENYNTTSNYTNLTNQFYTRISFRIMSDNSSDITKLEDVELLAQDISSKESGTSVSCRQKTKRTNEKGL